MLETPFSLSGFPLEIAVSVGIAAYPEHGESVDTLLQHADVAMYVAKDGHVGTALYESEQDTSDAARLALAGELRGAIDNEELVVHFQPKAELESGLIVGVEALVRWQHPERGFIPPNEFIPIAERTGLIKPLSQYVVASALRQCGEWRAAGFDLHVAVNLTIPDLLDLELPDRIGELLAETGVRPGQLELEVTETTILADPFRVRQVLNRLNEMGLRLAIDDFGTGYSSLAYLKNLPVHRSRSTGPSSWACAKTRAMRRSSARRSISAGTSASASLPRGSNRRKSGTHYAQTAARWLRASSSVARLPRST